MLSYRLRSFNISTTGATVVANNSDSDFALLRLTQDPATTNSIFTPYYLGWDRSGNAGTGNWVGIHHPQGDTKMISIATQVQNVATAMIIPGNPTSPANTHWHVQFSSGTMEEGSSGNPLLNSSGKVIGQLHGGYTGCSYPVNSYYGKFNVSWTGNSNSSIRRRLDHWLAPGLGNNAPQTIDGKGLRPPNEIYLQNKVETSNAIYNAINKIEAGKNVTANVPVGNYTVQSGAAVSFRAGNTIILSDGFVASAGSTFRAYIEPFFFNTYSSMSSANEENVEEQTPMVKGYTVEKSDFPKLEEDKLEKRIEDLEFRLKLYPNPSAGYVTIEYNINYSEAVEISLHDSQGRLVYQLKNKEPHEAGVYQITLDGTGLPTGTYFCTLQTGTKRTTERLLIVR